MKKHIFYLFFFFITSSLYSQTFDIRVRQFRNICSDKTVRDLNDPQMRWSLSSTKVEFYYIGAYDKTAIESLSLYNVKEVKVEDDPTNGKAYYYKVSNYKNGNGTLIYVPGEKFIKLTLDGSECTMTYDLY